jgi:hypothetical protein
MNIEQLYYKLNIILCLLYKIYFVKMPWRYGMRTTAMQKTMRHTDPIAACSVVMAKTNSDNWEDSKHTACPHQV